MNTITGRRPRVSLERMPEAEYHADPEPPSLSSSIAHEIIRRSASHGHARHPAFGSTPRKPTAEMIFGSAVHAMVLEPTREVAVVKASSWQGKRAEAERLAALAAGLIPVLEDELDDARRVADATRAALARHDIALDGESELTAFWTETSDDGAVVQCRARLDHLRADGRTIIDLKTTRSAHPEACVRSIDEYGYAIQHAAYVSALEHIRPALAGRVRMLFVFIETEPPHEPLVVRLNGEFRELGARRWRRAINAWARGVRDGEWSGYADGIVELAPKPWMLARDMEEQLAAASAAWSKEGDPF